ncbi:MAG: hypothetical protein WBA74_09935 [Cyclobacteriaceae bacterium]
MVRKFQEYIKRIDQMTTLITKNATGTRKEFARKLEISESSLFNYLRLIKGLGREVKYNYFKNCYHFTDKRRMKFFCGYISEEDYQKIKECIKS